MCLTELWLPSPDRNVLLRIREVMIEAQIHEGRMLGDGKGTCNTAASHSASKIADKPPESGNKQERIAPPNSQRETRHANN